MPLPPAVTIHGLAQARIALAPGLPVLLLSAPAAASYAGAAWWRALIAAAGAHHDALDCADEPGRALEALSLGCRIIILNPCPASPAIIEQAGPTLILPTRPPTLDLAHPGSTRHLLSWLDPAPA